MDNISYIYALVDPRDNEIRYVGKTIDLYKRILAHLTSTKDTKTHKKAWISGLQKEGLVPLVMLLSIVPKHLGGIYEKIWIKILKRKFKLTNITKAGDGGDTLSGTKRSKEWQDKIAFSNTGKKRTKQQRERIANGRRGIEVSPEGREKHRKSMLGKNTRAYKDFLLISPDGEVFQEIENLPNFARKHGTNSSQLRRLITGKRKSYKGWKNGSYSRN